MFTKGNKLAVVLLALGLCVANASANEAKKAATAKPPVNEAQAAPSPEMRRPPTPEEAQKQLKDDLRSKLKVTANQEDAFNKFIAAVLPNEGQRKKQDEATKLIMTAKTTVERMEAQLLALRDHEKALISNIEVVKAFYTILNPEQRKAFDEIGSAGRPPQPRK